MAVCQNLVPLVNIKIAGKWMFIPLKMVLIGIDPLMEKTWIHFSILLIQLLWVARLRLPPIPSSTQRSSCAKASRFNSALSKRPTMVHRGEKRLGNPVGGGGGLYGYGWRKWFRTGGFRNAFLATTNSGMMFWQGFSSTQMPGFRCLRLSVMGTLSTTRA